MSEPRTAVIRIDGLAKTLLSLLAAAFIAWAGVVWHGVESVGEVVAAARDDIEESLSEHERRPWHEEAGLLIRTNEARMIRFEKDLARLESKLDRLISLSTNNTASTGPDF